MKFTTYAAAAALAVGSLGFIGCDDKDDVAVNVPGTPTVTPKTDDRNAAQKTGDAIQSGARETGDAIKNAGAKIGGAIDGIDTPGNPNEEIRDVVAQVTEAAMKKGGFGDLVGLFVDADRNRLGQVKLTDAEQKDLDGKVEALTKLWKAKYNSDFDITDEDKVFPASFLAIQAGELSKAASGAELNVDTDRNPLTGTTETEIKVDEKSGVDLPGSPAADTNLNDPGRNVATLTVAAGHGAPELKVPLIHEAGGWKIDVPDNRDTQGLYGNVLGHLTEVGAMEWPASEEDAYRAFAHHMLMAVLGHPTK